MPSGAVPGWGALFVVISADDSAFDFVTPGAGSPEW